jgi:hypothetical protein
MKSMWPFAMSSFSKTSAAMYLRQRFPDCLPAREIIETFFVKARFEFAPYSCDNISLRMNFSHLHALRPYARPVEKIKITNLHQPKMLKPKKG